MPGFKKEVFSIHSANYHFFELDWDTQFFKIPCAKAVLEKPLNKDDWNKLVERSGEYAFTIVENRDAIPENSQWIGKNTKAFLADLSVVMEKELSKNSYVLPKNVEIHEAVEYNDQILKASRHTITRLISDPELLRRGGDTVLDQKLINSFGKKGKFFALSKNERDQIDGYFLFYFNEHYLQMEQASVFQSQKGIGTRLFQALEYAAWENGISTIKSGLSLYNIPSMNIHIKMAYKLIQCNQIYHLWNQGSNKLA